MAQLQFKEWMSKSADELFGFETETSLNKKGAAVDTDENPLNRLNISVMMDELVRLGHVNTKTPLRTWNGLVEYGHQPGAIIVDIMPLGSIRAVFRKLTTDLLGEHVWVCKRVAPLVHYYSTPHAEKEVMLAHNLHEIVGELDQGMLDSPQPTYPHFEKLVMATADAVRRDHPQVFIFEGVKKIDQNNYIIYMSYRGQGVEAPSQTRCEQFNINMQFNPTRGLIRSWGNEITSPTRQHLWKSNISEWDEFFTPTQHMNEIITAILKTLSTY